MKIGEIRGWIIFRFLSRIIDLCVQHFGATCCFRTAERKDKQLVCYGEIPEGMDQDAVALAWGNPPGQMEGLRDGKRMQC